MVAYSKVSAQDRPRDEWSLSKRVHVGDEFEGAGYRCRAVALVEEHPDYNVMRVEVLERLPSASGSVGTQRLACTIPPLTVGGVPW